MSKYEDEALELIELVAEKGVPLLGLGTTMLTTVDPWGAVGEWEEAALVILM